MLLAVDVGNTNTKCGLFFGRSLKATWSWPTVGAATAEDFVYHFKDALNQRRLTTDDVDRVVLGSVVPVATPYIDLAASSLFDCEPIEASVDKVIGMTIDYNPPESLGIDRLADALAARELADMPCIAVDMGTATTFNVVLKGSQPRFAGGLIAPGRAVLATALADRTARLPEVDLAAPSRLIGSSTSEALRSGSFHGYAAMIDGIVDRLRREIDSPGCPVIVTGGGATDAILSACGTPMQHEPHLTLHGLRLIYQEWTDPSRG